MLSDYEVIRLAGRGGMGAVYEARHKGLSRRVALKLMPPHVGDAPGFAGRFRHEARLTAQLDHPGIVTVYDSGETPDGHLWYAMEFVEGEDLAARLRRGPCPTEEAVAILTGVAEALEAAHAAGVLHRDIKPGNILLPAAGGVKLGDFGLAVTLNDPGERLTRAGSTVGTMEYAAPEQLSRSVPAGPAADIYSLGVVAYELLTGELPRGIFDPPSVRNPQVDPGFDGVVLRAMQSDPARRFATAVKFRDALRTAADKRERLAAEQRIVRQRLVRRARLAAVLAGVAIILGGMAVYAWLSRNEARSQRTAARKAETETNDLLQFLLTDLRLRLEKTGNLAAMESVLERAVVHYRELHERSGHSAETALTLAGVLTIKGDVIGNRGLTVEADALYTQAISLTELARAGHPQDPSAIRHVITSFLDRAEHRITARQFQDSLEDARRLLEESLALQNVEPGPASARAVGVAHRAIAHALAYTGPPGEARQEYDEAGRIFRSLAAAAPENEEFADEVASIDLALGSIAETEKDYPEMLEHFSKWHDYVLRRYGRENMMFSHSSFRMGLALTKSGRPAEAIAPLKDALRLAENNAAQTPGETGGLAHELACLRTLAKAYADSGEHALAGPLRAKEAEVAKLLAGVAGSGTSMQALQDEFARLAAAPDTSRDLWWSLCQRIEVNAEAEPSPARRQPLYEAWLARIAAAAQGRAPGDTFHTVDAFLHNRLAVLLLAGSPADSANHARHALEIRRRMAAVDPGNTVLQRDVLSSAGHLLRATVEGADADACQRAAEAFVAAAKALSPAAPEPSRSRTRWQRSWSRS